MSLRHIRGMSRRRLLQFLAASPLLARNAFAEGSLPGIEVARVPGSHLAPFEPWALHRFLKSIAEAR